MIAAVVVCRRRYLARKMRFELYSDTSCAAYDDSSTRLLALSATPTTYTLYTSNTSRPEGRQVTALAISKNTPLLSRLLAFRNLHAEPLFLPHRLLTPAQEADIFHVASPLVFARWDLLSTLQSSLQPSPSSSSDSNANSNSNRSNHSNADDILTRIGWSSPSLLPSFGETTRSTLPQDDDDGCWVRVQAVDSMAVVELAPNRRTIRVSFPARIAHEDVTVTGSACSTLFSACRDTVEPFPDPKEVVIAYTWVTQVYSVAWLPPRWIHPLSLALHFLCLKGHMTEEDVASVLDENEYSKALPEMGNRDFDDNATFATSSSIIMALPPCIDNAFAGGPLGDPTPPPSSLPGGPSVLVRDVVVSSLGPDASLRSAHVLSLRALPFSSRATGSVSIDPLHAYVLESKGKYLVEHGFLDSPMFTSSDPPPRLEHLLSELQILAYDTNLFSSLSPSPSPSPSLSPSLSPVVKFGAIEAVRAAAGRPAFSAQVLVEREMDGIGVFTAFLDGRVRGVFDDRTLVEIDPEGLHASLVLPSGEKVVERVAASLSAPTAVGYTEFFRRWAVASPADQLEALQTSSASAFALQRIDNQIMETRCVAARASSFLPASSSSLTSSSTTSTTTLISKIDALLSQQG